MKELNVLLTPLDFYPLWSLFTNLDWPFIVAFVLSGYFFLKLPIRAKIKQLCNVELRTRYWIALIGLLQGTIRSLALGFGGPELLTLIQSFLFAMMSYQLFLDAIIKWLEHSLWSRIVGWLNWFGEAGNGKSKND